MCDYNSLQTQRTIDIPIVDDLKPERDECFEIELTNPEGGAKLGRISKMAVTISNDDGESLQVQYLQ